MASLLRHIPATCLIVSHLAGQDPTPSPDDALLRSLRAELNAARMEIAELRELSQQPQSAIRGSVGVDVTTAYYFRGILQEDAGLIAQPSIELGWRLLGGDGAVRDVDLTFGTWNSAHSGDTGGPGGIWYESDVYATLSGTFFERLTIGTTYSVYHSPNGSFGTIEEQSLTIAFDDSGLLFDGGLAPSLTVAFELDGQSDGGTGLGSYAGFGIEPSFDLGSLGSLDLTLSVPVHVGFSLRDFYEVPGGGSDETFGFASVGTVVSCELPCMPECLGPWELSLGLQWLLLGDNNEARNSGDDDELIGTIGLRTTF